MKVSFKETESEKRRARNQNLKNASNTQSLTECVSKSPQEDSI